MSITWLQKNQSSCPEGYYQPSVQSSSCLLSNPGSYVSMTTGDSGNSSSSANNLSSTSASYTGRIGSQNDIHDYYKVNVDKSHHIFVSIISQSHQLNISLYDQSMVLIDYTTTNGTSISTNSTSSSSLVISLLLLKASIPLLIYQVNIKSS